MRVIEISGDTAVEYTKAMLAARAEVAAAGYSGEDTSSLFEDDVWYFGDNNGNPELCVIWRDAPAMRDGEAEQVAELLANTLV